MLKFTRAIVITAAFIVFSGCDIAAGASLDQLAKLTLDCEQRVRLRLLDADAHRRGFFARVRDRDTDDPLTTLAGIFETGNHQIGRARNTDAGQLGRVRGVVGRRIALAAVAGAPPAEDPVRVDDAGDRIDRAAARAVRTRHVAESAATAARLEAVAAVEGLAALGAPVRVDATPAAVIGRSRADVAMLCDDVVDA